MAVYQGRPPQITDSTEAELQIQWNLWPSKHAADISYSFDKASLYHSQIMDEPSTNDGIEITASTSVPIPAPLPAPASQIPYGLYLITPHLGRQGTGSTTGSIPFSQVPAGFWDTFIHGSCPRCHYWHNKVTLRVSRNPGVFNGIRCEKCAHKWFGIGGNLTHTSLTSQEMTDNFDENNLVVRSWLLQTMRDMNAVGSPALGIIQEDFPSATSPLSRHSLSRHHHNPSPTDIQSTNPPTTILQVPRDSLLHSTPSVHETHGTTQIQTKPSNNSSQGPRKKQKNFSMIRNIKNKIAKLKDRGKRQSAQSSPAAVKPADPTPTQETRSISPRQTSPIRPAASNASQPEGNLPERTFPTAIPNRTVLEFRDRLPRLTHRERIARLRRMLTEQKTCTCNNNTCSCRQRLRPSSSLVPDNLLVDTASIYPSNPSEESEPSFHDLLFTGSRFEVLLTFFTGPGSQNRQEERTLNDLPTGSHLKTPPHPFGDSNMRPTSPVTSPPRVHNRVSRALNYLGGRSLSGIGRSRYVDEEETATVKHTTATSGNSTMPNSYSAVTDSPQQEKDRNDSIGENAEEVAIFGQQLLTVDSIRPHLDRSLCTPANITHTPINPFHIPIESRNPPGEGRGNGAEQYQPVKMGPIAVIDSNVSLLERGHSVDNPRSTSQGLQLARNKGLLSTSDLQNNAPISKPHISQPPYVEYCEVQSSESPSIKSWVLKSIKVLVRPRIPLGLRRIEWTCVSFCNPSSF